MRAITSLNDPTSKNYRQSSDFCVGLGLICLSVFALRLGEAQFFDTLRARNWGRGLHSWRYFSAARMAWKTWDNSLPSPRHR